VSLFPEGELKRWSNEQLERLALRLTPLDPTEAIQALTDQIQALTELLRRVRQNEPGPFQGDEASYKRALEDRQQELRDRRAR
jgi:hypothetical protein